MSSGNVRLCFFFSFKPGLLLPWASEGLVGGEDKTRFTLNTTKEQTGKKQKDEAIP